MKLYEYVFELQDRVTKVMDRIEGGQGKLMRKFQQSQRAGVKAYDRVKSSAIGYEGVLNRIKRTAVGVFATGAMLMAARDLTAVTAKYEAFGNVISFASGAANEATKNQKFLNETIDRYKLPLESSNEGFSKLAGAMMNTKLQGQATRDIFEGVSVAATGLKMKSDAVNGSFLALSQIMSKGKVQAEELRGQLGERIPGAFNIAARAMGMTQDKLNKMLETGKVTAVEFLPKFAAELKKTFEGAIPTAINSLQANMNAYETQVTRLKVSLGNELKPAITAFFSTMSEGLKELSPLLIRSGQGLNNYLTANRDNLLSMMKSGVALVKYLIDHRKQIAFLVKAYVTYKAAMIGYNLAIKASTFLLTAYQVVLKTVGTVSLITATGIKTARDAMAAFNLVTGMSPIGAIAALLATAGTAFLLFRGKLKKSNDEFERFNKLNDQFKEGQKSREETTRLFNNLDKLNPRQRESLLSDLTSQRQGVEDQLMNSKLLLQETNISDLRKQYTEATTGNTNAAEIGNISRQINAYEKAESQRKKLSKSFDRLSNQISLVQGLVNVGNAPGGTGSSSPLDAGSTVQQGIDGVIAGGKKVTHVTLNIDTINGIGEVISTTVGENIDDISEKILEVMTRAINGGVQSVRN
jgi:tape measure domain-containing protein